VSSGMQSQDEVDAIMAGASGDAAPAEAPQGAPGGATGALPSLDQRPGGPEARQVKRARAKFTYSLMTKSAEGQDMKLSGSTEDISSGGVSILSAATIPPNAILAIRIELMFQGKHAPVIATGRCVHQTFSSKAGGFRYGVQFTKIGEEYKKIIDQYVKVYGVTPQV
jgi:hypothetical protein